MAFGITKLTIAQINENWAEKVRRSYEEMNAVPDMEELIRFLKEPAYSISFRYALCRFLRENYEVSDPDDIECYIRLMLDLARERGMEGQFQGKHLRRYLLGKQENVSRQTLMKMAFAFDMDCNVVCELLEAMDEVPYNFRDPYECICYFCQCTQESNHWEIYQRMAEEWEAVQDGDDVSEDEAQNGAGLEDESRNSAGLEYESRNNAEPGDEDWMSSWMEETILDLSYEEDLDVRIEKMMEYLKEHRRELCGYRRAAYAVLEDLLDELTQLTGASDDTELTIRLWDPIWVQFYTKKSDRTGVNRSDFVPWKDLLDLPRTIYEKPLWRARLAKLRARKVPVEKRDILFLNCMRWALSRENEGGIDAMNEFIYETNALLDECGLSMIYPPNPYDRMILLAICSASPIDILSDLFTAATDEEALEKKL